MRNHREVAILRNVYRTKRCMHEAQGSVRLASSAVLRRLRSVIRNAIEAVAARQAVATCQDGESRQSALKVIDAEIQITNDHIAEQSCGK